MLVSATTRKTLHDPQQMSHVGTVISRTRLSARKVANGSTAQTMSGFAVTGFITPVIQAECTTHGLSGYTKNRRARDLRITGARAFYAELKCNKRRSYFNALLALVGNDRTVMPGGV
jgi:hypothetical protein